jgi:hypothetical protein
MRLLIVGLTLTFGLTALAAVSRLRLLETSVTDVLSRNYRSIEAAGGMSRAVTALELAVREGRAADAAPQLRAQFEEWAEVERGNCTETGEAEVAAAIERRGAALFDTAAAGAGSARLLADATGVHRDLDALIALNKTAPAGARVDRQSPAARHRHAVDRRALVAIVG